MLMRRHDGVQACCQALVRQIAVQTAWRLLPCSQLTPGQLKRAEAAENVAVWND